MNNSSTIIQKHLAVRHRREKRFRLYGLMALGFAGTMLFVLFASIMIPGIKGFFHTRITLPVPVSEVLATASGDTLLREALFARFPDVTDRRDRRLLMGLFAPHASTYATIAKGDTSFSVPVKSPVDLWIKDGMQQKQVRHYGLQDKQVLWLRALEADDAIHLDIDWSFFRKGDSRDPEKAGFGGSMLGSVMVVVLCLAISLPLGVGAAIYLEEFARPSRFKDMIEVNINNLAAVPSIIYGLLGLFVYLALFGLPRSSALVGGLTLSMMTLPIIIIATRISINAVPKSLRDAARGIGASPLQVVTHHVLPQALPGIITGTILGMARAMGETAPLLMIGMVAFIANVPASFTDPATVMPVQIYLWASSPEQGFVQKTASGILVLISLLLCLNLIAAHLRSRFERVS